MKQVSLNPATSPNLPASPTHTHHDARCNGKLLIPRSILFIPTPLSSPVIPTLPPASLTTPASLPSLVLSASFLSPAYVLWTSNPSTFGAPLQPSTQRPLHSTSTLQVLHSPVSIILHPSLLSFSLRSSPFTPSSCFLHSLFPFVWFYYIRSSYLLHSVSLSSYSLSLHPSLHSPILRPSLHVPSCLSPHPHSHSLNLPSFSIVTPIKPSNPS